MADKVVRLSLLIFFNVSCEIIVVGKISCSVIKKNTSKRYVIQSNSFYEHLLGTWYSFIVTPVKLQVLYLSFIKTVISINKIIKNKNKQLENEEDFKGHNLKIEKVLKLWRTRNLTVEGKTINFGKKLSTN